MSEKLTYLITLLVFAVSAVSIEWFVGYRKLKKYLKLIGVVVLICLLGGVVADNVAIDWRIWVYHPERFSAVYILGIPLETYLFIFFVAIAVSTAALTWSDFEDQGRPLVKGTFDEVAEKVKRLLTI